MKKILLLLVGAFLITGLQAQGTFKIGLSGGIPLGDASDFSSFALGADAYYLFGKRKALVRLGPTVGFRNFFGDEISPGISVDDAQFLPVALAGRISIFGILQGGIDAGYAVGITDGLDGGFYIRPILALGLLRFFELNFSYESISDNASWGNANIGLLLVF
ncbi:MAG: hypothetical protein WBM43_01925 [Flavobacteriaceae bacterium]